MNRNLIRIGVAFGVALILIILFANQLFFSINPGERGVIYKRFRGGLDKENVLRQGFHWKAPWNRVIIYNVQKQKEDASMNVLSSNGLEIQVDVTTRYHLIEDKIGFLHNEIGKNYRDRIIGNEIWSKTREVIGQYTPQELYSKERKVIQDEIEKRAKKVFEDNFISLDALLIRSIKLPPQITKAIERKLSEEQAIQQKQYSVQKAEKEAERRKAEARGKAEANRILDRSLTDKVLKDKAIEATEELSKSENSKVVVIGSGKDGLPVILGNQ